jgi:hypothetical protein
MDSSQKLAEVLTVCRGCPFMYCEKAGTDN